jgi:hypothetical protein
MFKRFLLLILLYSFVYSSAFSFFQNVKTYQSIKDLTGFENLLFPQIQPRTSETSLYFTGAGIYLWWQLGAVKYMQDHYDMNYLRESVICGASAGSVSAAFLLLECDVEKAPKLAIDIAERYDVFSRKTGLAGVCRELMKTWLDELIPNEVKMEHLNNLYVAATNSRGQSELLTSFDDRDDLIDGLLTSCHVPFFLDGKAMTTYRGKKYFDGAFWYFVTKNRMNGLPFPDEMNQDNLFWIDYGDDNDFMQSVSGNFLELISPDKVYEMMEYGYNHVKKEEYLGRSPFKKKSFGLNPITFTKSMRLPTLSIPQDVISLSSQLSLPDLRDLPSRFRLL